MRLRETVFLLTFKGFILKSYFVLTFEHITSLNMPCWFGLLNTPTAPLQRGKTRPQWMSSNDTKPSDGSSSGTLWSLKYPFITFTLRSILTRNSQIDVCKLLLLDRKTWVQSQVESYQRLKKWYLMPPCLTLSIIRYGSWVKWSNPGKGVAPSPTPWCSSYRKGNLRVTLDYSRQLYLYITVCKTLKNSRTKTNNVCNFVTSRHEINQEGLTCR